MKAFLASTAVAIVIAVVASLVLHSFDFKSADVYQSKHGSVRL